MTNEVVSINTTTQTPVATASDHKVHSVSLSDFTLEGLAPELHKFVCWNGHFGPSFDHPLYRDVTMLSTAAAPAGFFHPDCPGGLSRINEIVAAQQRAVEDFERKQKWGAYVFSHHRPYRVDALLSVIQRVGISRLWRLVSDVWIDSESTMQSADEWAEIWMRAYDKHGNLRKCFKKVMGAKDLRVYETLPDIVTAYRGCFDEYDSMAYSWTLDREVAEWFAKRKRWKGNPIVAKVEVPKSFVLAYFDGRREAEVVLDYNAGLDGYDFEITELPAAEKEIVRSFEEAA